MAAGSLLTLLDDIATLMDDVAAQAKTAASKTAGVLGDDLALNAQQVTGVRAERELPVVWAVAKGSLLNKALIVPGALLVSAFAPWAIIPTLMIGGAYLCFEGFEKVMHKVIHPEIADERQERVAAASQGGIDMVAFERDKIKGAIRTDAVLSLEIIVLALAVVATEPLLEQFLTLTVISLLMTAGVYGFVAGIVRMDDMGLFLKSTKRKASQKLGSFLLWGAPVLMKALAFVGTVAMFLVGGGIMTHGLPPLHHLAGEAAATLTTAGPFGQLLATVSGVLVDGVAGLVTGALLVGGLYLAKLLLPRKAAA